MLNHWHGTSRMYWLKTRKHGMVYLSRWEHLWDHFQNWIEQLFKRWR